MAKYRTAQVLVQATSFRKELSVFIQDQVSSFKTLTVENDIIKLILGIVCVSDIDCHDPGQHGSRLLRPGRVGISRRPGHAGQFLAIEAIADATSG